jgi:hypothetical protein
MERATARLWREGARWVIQIDIDGACSTERDYAHIADACHAIAQILRQRGERRTDVDQDACELCEEPLDLQVCSQCGLDAFVRICEHGGPRPIRDLDGALYCLTCRPEARRGRIT